MNHIMWISLRATPYVFISLIIYFKIWLNQRNKIEINKTILLIIFSIITISMYSLIKGQVFGSLSIRACNCYYTNYSINWFLKMKITF